MSLRGDARHYSFGRHSDIPVCCTLFFIEFYGSMHLINEQRDLLLGIGGQFGYVPCSLCLARGEQVTVHMCEGLPCEGRYWWRKP